MLCITAFQNTLLKEREVTGRQERRCKPLLDGRKKKKGCSPLEEEAPDRIL
jgi:hypothetical protein